jgi:hypothetical protein
MTTKAFYHPRGIVVDLGEDLPTAIYNELVTFHGKIRRDEPVVTCLKTNDPMYLYRHPTGRYYLRHFAGEGDHGSHSLTTMSVEHRRQAEYTERAADTAGIKARLEVSTGTTPSGRQSTRLDVGVWGARNVGFEIQRSQLSLAQAMDRASRSYENGWPTVWITDAERDPAWADRVPTARMITRGGWDERTLDPNTARVAISRFRRERDSSRASGWSYCREPVSVLLDELACLVPAGDVVPVVVGTKGMVVLAFKDAADVIDSCTYPGASRWDPVGKLLAKKERRQLRSLECHHKDAARPADQAGGQPAHKSTLPQRDQVQALISNVQRDVAEPIRSQDESEVLVALVRGRKPSPPQCPGCPTMHDRKPCFPGCWKAGGA